MKELPAAKNWVCPRNPDHPPLKNPIPVLGALCGHCVRHGAPRADMTPAPEEAK